MAAYYVFNSNTGEKMMIDDDVDLVFVDYGSVDRDGAVTYHGTFKPSTDGDPMALYLTTPTDDFVRLTQKPEVIHDI